MATTVIQAFDEFLDDKVDLDPTETKKARASRDWLIEQIHALATRVEDFPSLYTEKDIAFGSFARGTKIRELDDIDLMIGIHAQGAKYTSYSDPIQIVVPDTPTPLQRYCNAGTHILNSRMVINKFVSALSDVPQYRQAEMKRTLEAATLNLTSYTWCFDIVPCFFTTPEADGREFYLIPDGYGNWKKTDPRKDRDVVGTLNRTHSGNMLKAIRVMKFWNRRRTAPAMSSYLFETLLLRYYLDRIYSTASKWVDVDIPGLLDHISTSVTGPIIDLKGIQGDINALSVTDREKISLKALQDRVVALEARIAETKQDQQESIRKWGQVFGPQFPAYG